MNSNKVNPGDFCILRGGDGLDTCVRVLKEVEPWEGAQRFMGEKISLPDNRVVVRRVFFTDQVLKTIKPPERDKSGLSDATSLQVN